LENELKNLFSKQSADYAKYRPHYPKELFESVVSWSPSRERAWDCATGNGQAAVDLAGYFDEVFATDVSEAQIHNALAHPKVRYSVAPAEKTALESRSLDLVTVAQAIHWFDHGPFYEEVRRVLKPKGILALWCYGHNRKVEASIEPLYRKYSDLVKPYWAPQINYIWEELKTIPFPFEELRGPSMTLEADWDLDSFIGYLRSWSATQKYIEREGVNPLERMSMEFKEAWGPPSTRYKMTWPVYFRIGRV